MKVALSKVQWLWWFAVAFLILNSLAYMHVVKKMDALENSISLLGSRPVLLADSQVKPSEMGVDASIASRRKLPDSSSSSRNVADAVDRIRQFKQRKRNTDPVTLAANLSNRMATERSLPKIEQQHSTWLDDTLKQMPADAPHARSVETTCQGRRCLVSAVFTSVGEAEAWSRRYVLKGGGRMLQGSNTVIVPLGGADQSVALQLYFY